MKRFMISSAALLLAISAVPVQAETEIEQAPLSWQQAAVEDGGALYLSLCAVCHGTEGKGDGPAAPALKAQLSDLTRLSATHDGEFPAALVDKVLTGGVSLSAHGSAEMPVWGRAFEDTRLERKPGERWAFSRARIYNLTRYLESIQVE